MTPVHIALIESSFAEVVPVREQAAAIFCAAETREAWTVAYGTLSSVMIAAADALPEAAAPA